MYTVADVVLIARLEQILENWRNKSTGNLAFLTNVLNFGGNIARTFTVLTETKGDLLLLGSTAIPVLVNGFIFLQFLMYWNNSIGAQSTKPASSAKTKKSQ